MELREAMEARRSMRKYEAGKKVTREQVEELIQAAYLAPSWKNSETPRYYVAMSEDVVRDIRENCLPAFNQNNSAGAPVLIVTAFVKGISGFNPDGTACNELFYPQLGVKLCSMAGGGVQKIYMVFLREPSRRDRSGSDLFHLRDGFEIKMNFDRNVSCFIFVNALMHDDFFD